MTTLNRRAAALLLFLPLAVGCGGKQEPAATPPPATLAASPVVPAAPAMPVLTPLSPPPSPAAAATPSTTAPRSPAAATPRATAAPPATAPLAVAPPTTVVATPAANAAPTPSPAAAEAAPPGTPPATAPAATLPKRPRPKGKVALPAKLGTVTFDHQKHAEAMAIPCAKCHHASRPEKPLAAERQSCRECHTSPPAAPMKTSLQAAFHDPKASAGTCLTCHKEAVAKGKQVPVRCMDCHKK